jgi:hypothetical protein
MLSPSIRDGGDGAARATRERSPVTFDPLYA